MNRTGQNCQNCLRQGNFSPLTGKMASNEPSNLHRYYNLFFLLPDAGFNMA